MRIDSHQHFWKYNSKEYGWIDESMSVLRRDFLPEDLRKIYERNGIDGCVAVQARQCLEETEWLLGLAGRNQFIKGVVGWVNLVSKDVESDLARFTLNKKFKGVRHVVQDEPDERFIVREDFIRGVGSLGRYGLTYDILIFPQHIKYAAEFVGKFPEQAFVVDHIAKPSIKNGIVEPWRSDMRRLARFENVYCKLSGIVTEASRREWKKNDFTVYMEAVLDIFGTDRVMFGSDWPVCTVAAEYEQVLEIVTDFIAALGQSEQAKIMGLNASAFYGL